MRQVAIARRIGLSQTSYRLFENGERIPSMPTMVKIARYYNLGVEDIWTKDQIANLNKVRGGRQYGKRS